MFGDEKNLKDTTQNSLKDSSSVTVPYTQVVVAVGSYLKTDKLITALYMVTDILPENEPIKDKLRDLGLTVLSDSFSLLKDPSKAYDIENNVNEILSLLSISSSIGMMSEMNANILQKEFFELKKALGEHTDSKYKWLSEFLASRGESDDLEDTSNEFYKYEKSYQNNLQKNRFQGHPPANSFSKKKNQGQTERPNVFNKNLKDKKEILKDMKIEKHKRQDEIVKIIKENKAGLTISDIRSKGSASIKSCGEKTLQRELVSMVTGGVLKKEGEKRWSKYLLAE